MNKPVKKKFKLMTRKDLLLCLAHIDKTFFDRKIPGDVRVQFVKNLTAGGDRVDGCYDDRKKMISVDANLRQHPDLANIVLIHESVHSIMPEYEGMPPTKDHGLRFQAKLFELFMKGAYDGLL